MKKLQPREKNMLIVLVLVAIVLLPAYFLISPLMQSNTELEAELQDLSIRRQELEIALMSNSDLEESLEESRLKLTEGDQVVPTRLKSYDMHYTVEDVCRQTGVTLKDLSIGEYEPVTLTDENGEAMQTQIVYNSQVRVSFSADNLDAIISAVDALVKNEYALLTGCTISIPESRQQLPSALIEEPEPAAAETEDAEAADTEEAEAVQPEIIITQTEEQMIECSLTLNIYAVLQPDDPDFIASVQAAQAANEQAVAEETEEATE